MRRWRGDGKHCYLGGMSSDADHARLPVVIINGLGAPRVAAQLYGALLEKRGFRVFAAEQRALGYGDIRANARRLRDDIERAREQSRAERVKLVGMSLGGIVGLWYLKHVDEGAVERFVSIGGPLNGARLARAATLLKTRDEHALMQLAPGSGLLEEIGQAPTPERVRLYSVGTVGDVVTPRESWDHPEFEAIETPHGAFPIGHWLLFTHPGNHAVVAELLARP